MVGEAVKKAVDIRRQVDLQVVAGDLSDPVAEIVQHVQVVDRADDISVFEEILGDFALFV